MRKLCVATLLLFSITAAVAHPGSAIAVDRRGVVYFVDTGGGVWMIPPGGKLTRHAGPAFHWMALDPTGKFEKVPLPKTSDAEIRAAGSLLLSSDFPITVGSDGALYFAEFANGNLRMIRFAPDGTRSVRATLPGPSEWINGITAGPDGSLYYTEHTAVRKVDAKGTVTTLAEKVAVPDCATIPANEPLPVPYLRGLALGADGRVYVAAAGCGVLLEISPRGVVKTLLRTSAPWSPTDVAVHDGSVYVLEYLHTASDNRVEWLPRVRKIARDGTVSTIAAISGR
jgi:hypothetical protein